MEPRVYAPLIVSLSYGVAIVALVLHGNLDGAAALAVLSPIIAYWIPSPLQPHVVTARAAPPIQYQAPALPLPARPLWAAARAEMASSPAPLTPPAAAAEAPLGPPPA